METRYNYNYEIHKGKLLSITSVHSSKQIRRILVNHLQNPTISMRSVMD
jgi:hypothetical protein